jgi:type IV secretory pathway VirJ component
VLIPPAADTGVHRAPTSGANAFALLLTGDGGWAGLDQEVSAQLAARGLPVVGLNTLKYFWKARTPEQAAADVARVLRHYLEVWKKDGVVLVGYSFGADVLPFIVNRLPEELRARLASLNLIGLSGDAEFEIHVTDWIPGGSDGGLPVAPELARLGTVPVRCFYGEGEADSLCPSLPKSSAVQIGTGHHLSGRYEEIAQRILAHP